MTGAGVARLCALTALVATCDRAPSVSPPPATSAPAAPMTAVAVMPVAPGASSSDVSALDAAPRSSRITVTFDADALAGAAPEFEPVIGAWYVADGGGQRGLRVDGSKWRQGAPSDGLDDQAKRLFGDRSAAFVGGVKAFASFPLAVWTGAAPAGDVAISVRFFPEAGKIDQGAGIAFDIAADGSYSGVRANALEGNLLFFHVVKGHRAVLDDVSDVPTPSKTWHVLALEIRGRQIVATVDGQRRLEKTLGAAPAGRVGLWSKADSRVLFDDFTVTQLTGAAP